jgi:hypothetical protein
MYTKNETTFDNESDCFLLTHALSKMKQVWFIRWFYLAVCFKFANHLYRVIESLQKIVFAFCSEPVAALTLFGQNMSVDEWYIYIIDTLIFTATPPRFLTLTLQDVKKMWALDTTRIHSSVFDVLLPAAQFIGVFDYESTLTRANTKIVEVNGELSVLFRQRDFLYMTFRASLYCFFYALLVFLFVCAIARCRSRQSNLLK